MTGQSSVDPFRYVGDRLRCEDVDLGRLVSWLGQEDDDDGGDGSATATPLYVYSKRRLLHNVTSYKEAFRGRDHIIGFSFKV